MLALVRTTNTITKPLQNRFFKLIFNSSQSCFILLNVDYICTNKFKIEQMKENCWHYSRVKYEKISSTLRNQQKCNSIYSIFVELSFCCYVCWDQRWSSWVKWIWSLRDMASLLMSLGTTSWPCQIKSSVCWSTSSERTVSDDRFWVNCNPFKMTCTKVLSLLKSQLTPIAFLTQKQET